MANKLPNEAELFQHIRENKILISTALWELIYSHIEDNLSVIKLLLTLHLDQNENVPLDELKKINLLVSDVSAVFRKLINPQVIKTEDKGFIKIKEESQNFPPSIRKLLGHYIGNDIQSVNFIVGGCMDDEKAMDTDICRKLLDHIHSMEEFLTRLKLNTETLEERVKNLLTIPLVYLNNLKSELEPSQAARIDKCVVSLEEINGLIRRK